MCQQRKGLQHWSEKPGKATEGPWNTETGTTCKVMISFSISLYVY
jgi:hypothetical protein